MPRQLPNQLCQCKSGKKAKKCCQSVCVRPPLDTSRVEINGVSKPRFNTPAMMSFLTMIGAEKPKAGGA